MYIKYLIIASLTLIAHCNSFAQKSKTTLLKPGLYFFSQRVSEWVGGGYYILKPDSSFVFFSTLWDNVANCGAMDVNPNYYGVGVWKVSNNRLRIEFKRPRYNLLRFNNSIIYSAKNKGDTDSVFIHLITDSGFKNWFCELISINKNKKRKIIRPNTNKESVTLSVSASDKPLSINMSADGYYLQEIELLAGYNFHSIYLPTLQQKGNECFQDIEPQIVDWEIKKTSEGKLSYGSMLQISDVSNQKEDILLKLKITGENNSFFNLLIKELIKEIEKASIRQ